MERLKIAILGSRGIPAKYGAYEQCAEQLGVRLVQRGHEVQVACPLPKDGVVPLFHKGVQLLYCRHPSGHFGSLVYDLAAFRKVMDWADVTLMLGYASVPFLLPFMLGKNVVVNTDGLEWRRSKWPWYGRQYLHFAQWGTAKAAPYLVSDSLAIQALYKERYGMESTYIAYGTELETLNWGKVGYEPRYTVVMRMEPENSIKMIVEGFLLSESPCTLDLIGPSTAYFEREVKPLLKGQDRVKYLGPIYDRTKLMATRRTAFGYIHGHTVGGTNPTLLEAMACGNLIIARESPFNREVTREEALYFDSPHELSAALHQIEHLSQQRNTELRRSLRQRAETDFSWEHITDQYEVLFRKIIS